VNAAGLEHSFEENLSLLHIILACFADNLFLVVIISTMKQMELVGTNYFTEMYHLDSINPSKHLILRIVSVLFI